MPTRGEITQQILTRGLYRWDSGTFLVVEKPALTRAIDRENLRPRVNGRPMTDDELSAYNKEELAPHDIKITEGIALAIRELRVDDNQSRPQLRPGVTLESIALPLARSNLNNPGFEEAIEEWARNPNVTADDVRIITLEVLRRPNSTTLITDLKPEMDRLADITSPNLPANPVTPPPASNPSPSTAAGVEPIAPSPPQGLPQSPAQQERYVLPEVLDQRAFNSIRGASLLLATAVFPPDENGNSPVANDLATFRTLTESDSFYTAFKDRYDKDPAMRATYQRLMDMIAENEGGEMDPRVRRPLESMIREMLRDGNKLHNAEFLGKVDNLLDGADNPAMGFLRMIMDAVKGFFGSFFGELGITGPDVLNRMFSDGKNMVMDGLSQLPFVGQFFAGNANGENIRGLERSLREQDLGQHYSVVRNSAGAPQEYVFVDVRTRDDKGTGFMIREDRNIPDSLARRNNMYFDSMDREGRGDNERVWREGTVAIPKDEYDRIKNDPVALEARVRRAEVDRNAELARLNPQPTNQTTGTTAPAATPNTPMQGGPGAPSVITVNPN